MFQLTHHSVVQPPWDEIIKQLRVNHLSVIGVNGPEHRYNKLQGQRNPLFQIHQLPTTCNLLIIYCSKNPTEFLIYNERRISKPANEWKDSSDFMPLVVMVGVPLLSLISQLCPPRQSAVFVREREMVCLLSATAPSQGWLCWFDSSQEGLKVHWWFLDPIPHRTEWAYIQESAVGVPFPWTHHVV